jgi:hypothetical protein
MTAKQPFVNDEQGTDKNVGSDHRLLWGVLLIGAGLFFLAQNLGVFDFLGFIPQTLWSIFWMGAFGVAGLAFLGGAAPGAAELVDGNPWLCTARIIGHHCGE